MKEGEPATSLQIRLADGSKLTGRFNLTQTVQDVKRCVACSDVLQKMLNTCAVA